MATCALWDLLTRIFVTPDAISLFARQFPAHWPEFIAGMLAASYIVKPRQHQLKTAALIMLCVSPLCIASLPLRITGVIHASVWGAFYSCAIIIINRMCNRYPPTPHSVVTLLSRLGIISYSFYLLHQPVLLLMSPLAHRLHLSVISTFMLSIFCGIPLMIAIAKLYYTFVERPFLYAGSRDAGKSTQ